MAGKVIDITLNPKEPQLAEIFGGHSSPQYINVKEDGNESMYVVFPFGAGERADDAFQELLAEKIAQIMLQDESLEETIKRLDAMSRDAGETVDLMEFDSE